MRKQQNTDADLYLRLSKDDSNGNVESMSIANQRDFLTAYCNERGWNVRNVYIDDGISGTTFDRPAFQQMIRDVEAGKIQCIVTKDLSRLGRNYVETGQYTDFFFPRHNVRYIAVNDNYDTLNDDNDIAPFKNILNEMYAKDISKKVRSSRTTSAKQGKFVGSKSPYGYIKSPADKHRLEVDPEAAAIIRRIFKEFANGDSGRNIAIRLNVENVDCPRAYYYKRIGRENPNPTESQTWGSNTVMQLLKNPAYIGHMVQGKRKNVSFKSKQRESVDCENWIVVENTHEPIVDTEIWERVKKRLDETKSATSNSRIRTNSTGKISIFSGIIRCGDCGSAMAFNRKSEKQEDLYRCSRYANHGKEQCTPHLIPVETLRQAILSDIQYYAAMAVKDENNLIQRLLSSTGKGKQQEQSIYKTKLCNAKKRVTDIDNMSKKLFEEKYAGNVPDSIFKKLMKDYEAEQVELNSTIADLENNLGNIASTTNDITKWIELIKQYIHIQDFDRAAAVELIDCIEVSEAFKVEGIKQYDIKIKYRFVGFVESQGQIPFSA